MTTTLATPSARPNLPTPRLMYRALIERNTSYDGAFFAGVRTTGIFCRPGCGAKKPRAEHVEFFATAADALHAGFRPCQRCRPLDPAGRPPPWVSDVLDLANGTLDRRLSAADLRCAGVEPIRAARYFKRHYGMTFQAYHRARRVGAALRPLRNGQSVLREAVGRGFESERGLRAAFIRLFGQPPTKAIASDARILAARWLPSPLGPLLAIAADEGVCLLEFIDRRAFESQIGALRRRIPGVVVPQSNPHVDKLAEQLAAYFAGVSTSFDVPVLTPGTPFQQRVWSALRQIPTGQTRSYADIARQIGQPRAVRAVARANGQNRIALLVPCHRVIGSDGSPTGYGGGLWRKTWLLDHERTATRRS